MGDPYERHLAYLLIAWIWEVSKVIVTFHDGSANNTSAVLPLARVNMIFQLYGFAKTFLKHSCPSETKREIQGKSVMSRTRT